jgi:hypothetical protein
VGHPAVHNLVVVPPCFELVPDPVVVLFDLFSEQAVEVLRLLVEDGLADLVGDVGVRLVGGVTDIVQSVLLH